MQAYQCPIEQTKTSASAVDTPYLNVKIKEYDLQTNEKLLRYYQHANKLDFKEHP